MHHLIKLMTDTARSLGTAIGAMQIAVIHLRHDSMTREEIIEFLEKTIKDVRPTGQAD